MYLATEVEPEHGARSSAAKKERPPRGEEVLRLHVPAVQVQEWSRVRGPNSPQHPGHFLSQEPGSTFLDGGRLGSPAAGGLILFGRFFLLRIKGESERARP